MSKIREIINGWGNLVNKKEHIEALAKKRLEVCNECEFHSKNFTTKRPDDHCTACGCTLAAKTRSIYTSCPKNKWDEAEKAYINDI